MAGGRRDRVGTNQEDVRRHNLGTVVGHVHRTDGVSRAELTSLTGLNRSTIAGLVTELADLGLVKQVRPSGAQVGAGRPSPVVVPRPDAAHVVAIDVRVDGLAVARVGLGGRILARATGPAPEPYDPQAVCESLVDLVRLVLKGVATASHTVGIGVAVPGAVRASDGVVRLAPNLGWVDVPLARLLDDALDRIALVSMGNDADLGALAEHLRGAAVAADDVIYLSGEVGVGAGIIVDGHRLDGAGGYAGEIGHLSFDPQGRACHCGNRGCWETQIGAAAIAEAIGCPPERIASLAEVLEGIEAANDDLREVGRLVGRGLAAAVNLLNPEVVVLGGFLRTLYPLVRSEVDDALHGTALVAPRQHVRIALPGLGADSVLLGAAELGFQRLLDDPVASLPAVDDRAPAAG